MVLITFLVVIFRYVFNIGWVWMQEIVLYMHAFVFLVGAGYTLFKDAHVRVDIFYRRLSDRKKAWVNLLGSIFLLFPTCGLIFYQACPFVLDSWKVLEGSKDGGGLEGVYLLKTTILIYCALLLLQGVSICGRSLILLKEKEKEND